MPTSASFLESLLPNTNIQAALKTIRHTEGTSAPDGYQYLFTSSPHNNLRFTDFSTHPNKLIKANGISSDAAGAYQILYKTYTYLCKKYGFDGRFDEHSQNMLGLAILDEINVLMAVSKGLILQEQIMTRLSGQWASLPFAKYGQPTHSIADVRSFYLSEGGSIGGLAV